jgi:hypothetical protein
MTDTTPTAVAILAGLTDLENDAYRHARATGQDEYGVHPQTRELNRVVADAVAELAARRRDERSTATLDTARNRVRAAILTATAGQWSPHGTYTAHDLAGLVAAYNGLGGDLELDRGARALEAEQRVAELEQAIDRVLDLSIRTNSIQVVGLLKEGALEDLGAALGELNLVR